MRTSNPALNDNAFSNIQREATSMTLECTALKTLFLVLLVVVGGTFTWQSSMDAITTLEPAVVPVEGHTHTLSKLPAIIWHYVIWGALIAFVVAIFTIFNPKASPILAPIYALIEGASLGALSALFEYMYPGIVVQAVGCTVGTLAALLIVYLLRIVKATENFKLGVMAATGGIALYYLFAIGLGFFGVEAPLIHETGWMGIGFSIFVIIIAALNLVLDFDFIEKGIKNGAPKYMEWYAGFGLLITLVWIYLEFLRLLAKLRSSN